MKRAVYRVQFVGGEWHVGGPDVPKPLHWLRTSGQAIEVARLPCSHSSLIPSPHP